MDINSRTLHDELAKHIGKTVFLGARSSFFYIGPCEEAISDLFLIGLMECSYAAIGRASKNEDGSLNNQHKPRSKFKIKESLVGDRRVTEVYGRGDGVVIIVEGGGFGAFWTRNEYLAGKDVFLKAIEMASQKKKKILFL